MITDKRLVACVCDICEAQTSEFCEADERAPFRAGDIARASALDDGWRVRRFPLAAVLVKHGVPPTLAAAVVRLRAGAVEGWIVCPQCAHTFDAQLEPVPSD